MTQVAVKSAEEMARNVVSMGRCEGEESKRLLRLMEVFNKCSDSIVEELRSKLDECFLPLRATSINQESVSKERIELIYDHLFRAQARANMQEEIIQICKENRLAEKLADLERVQRGDTCVLAWRDTTAKASGNSAHAHNSELAQKQVASASIARKLDREAHIKAKRDRRDQLRQQLADLEEKGYELQQHETESAAAAERFRAKDEGRFEVFSDLKKVCSDTSALVL